MISHIRKGDFIVKESSINGGGNGLFAKRDIPSGKVLPYTGIIKKTKDTNQEDVDTYYMSATYIDEEGIQKTYRGFISDANPLQESLKDNPISTMAAYVNEASDRPPNCIFATRLDTNPEYIKDCYKNSTHAVLVYLVVTNDIKKGTELFTLYGSQYSNREYKVWRDRKGYVNSMVEKAIEILQTEFECVESDE